MQGYTDTIRKYAAKETHTGLLENPDGIGEVGLSGQEIGKRLAVRFSLKLSADRVAKIRFQVFGCGFTIAACAAAAELADGRSLADVQTLDSKDIDKQLGGLPTDRDYCAKLAMGALQSAIESLNQNARPVQASLDTATEERPTVSKADPVYQALLASTPLPGQAEMDRQMFASVLNAAAQETGDFWADLGLETDALNDILNSYFPGVSLASLNYREAPEACRSELNQDVLKILLSHVPCDATGGREQTSEWLARIIAARTAKPGHLWMAMGFFERPELTAAIKRHLPTLAAANNQGMRWKRYLFKQVCDLNGGTMCKAPNCGECSDYALCFTDDDN